MRSPQATGVCSDSTATKGVAAGTGASEKRRCLIGCSGSVAAIKLPELVAELSKQFQVMVVCTQNALFFLKRAEQYNDEYWRQFLAVGGWSIVLFDSDEWDMWNKIGNAVLHIELRRWADILLVAPASANFMAKASVGMADNLLMNVLRAWDYRKPCIICPAMNTVMWEQPITEVAIRAFKRWGCEILGPVEKLLACNERGNGAMASVSTISAYLFDRYGVANIHQYDEYVKGFDNRMSRLGGGGDGGANRRSSEYGSGQLSPITSSTTNELHGRSRCNNRRNSVFSTFWGSFGTLLVGIGIGLGFGFVMREGLKIRSSASSYGGGFPRQLPLENMIAIQRALNV